MLHKHSRRLAILLGLCAACGGDDEETDLDGGHVSDAAADARTDSGTGDTLQPGDYDVSSIQMISDGCKMELNDGSFTQQRLENTGTTISIGKYYTPTDATSWNPAGYALGTGPWLTARTTTLTVSSHVKFTEAGRTCEYDTMRTSNVTYTGPNAVSIDFTNNETNHAAACGDFGLATTNCTSHWTFKLTKPITAGDQ